MQSSTELDDEAILRVLQDNAPNIEGLMMLYVRTAPAVWTFAQQRTTDRQTAWAVCKAVYLHAADRPSLLVGRVSLTTKMLMLVYLETGSKRDHEMRP